MNSSREVPPGRWAERPARWSSRARFLGAADLHHGLHGLKTHPQIQGASAYDPADQAVLHRRLDRLPLGAIDSAVVETQQALHFRTGELQALMPPFRPNYGCW